MFAFFMLLHAILQTGILKVEHRIDFLSIRMRKWRGPTSMIARGVMDSSKLSMHMEVSDKAMEPYSSNSMAQLLFV